MPTYDYKCTSCGKEQELFLPMQEATKRLLKPCTECTNNILEKQISGTPEVKFIGPGFYVNDYKKQKH